jgi:hypothetical protein
MDGVICDGRVLRGRNRCMGSLVAMSFDFGELSEVVLQGRELRHRIKKAPAESS